MRSYPKRLIEVDLPIKRISAHARREKSIRHGHISTLHIWWARRPLAACRAVLCAALWPDPADPLCPQIFRDEAARLITAFAEKAATDKNLSAHCAPDTWGRWVALSKLEGHLDPHNELHWNTLRFALLDFIADFANWDNSTVPEYLETSRALTQAAHEALGGIPGTKPLVVDPFAGGGAIPLEALRIGADAFASDLNPVAVLLNKVVLEYIPKYGKTLADEVRKWGAWVKEQAEKELAEFYPKDPDGAVPIAYLWARTVTCEGPGCGAEVPLIRSLWLSKKAGRAVALKLVPDIAAKRVGLELIENAKAKDIGEGTVKKGAATCPVCGYTTPVTSVRRQLKTRRGGAADARLFCVVTTNEETQGRFYRLPTDQDRTAVCRAISAMRSLQKQNLPFASLSPVPNESISLNEIRRISVPLYGIENWGDCFSPRQALTLATLVEIMQRIAAPLMQQRDVGMAIAIQTGLALVISRQANALTSLSRWHVGGEKIEGVFARQAIPMLWDFVEGNPLSGATGDFSGAINWVAQVCEANAPVETAGHVENASATSHPLPDDAANAFITDPPYYDAIPYAYLSDFFYVWMRRTLGTVHPDLFREAQVPKDEEIVVDRPHVLSSSHKDVAFYERELTKAFSEGRRITHPDGIATIVFASKTTSSWEAILQAVIQSGWIVTASWPIDTEMAAKVAAIGQARLMSSVHLVCRPRENPDGSLQTEIVGDWRDVLQELPRRIHDWMPRLAAEGVVGADAIFACLGPALEVFSRYSRVEKASGEVVPLREYLEHVWASVAREALRLIFSDTDATGFEEDARLTAMWFWTLSTGATDTDADSAEDESEDEEGDDGKRPKVGGFALEYDAARKIAQGLGAHMERMGHLVEIKGETARLLPVSERTRYLFGKDEADAPMSKKAKRSPQLSLNMMDELDRTEGDGDGWGRKGVPQPGSTVLDRVHQAMILFAAGRSEAMRRFIVDEGAGSDVRFWRLAQALSALYPAQTDEKRWVDGVLARKKGLGF